MRFGFAGLGLASVWAGCDDDNIASIRVLEKLGMTLQPRPPNDTNVRGERHDSLMFRIRSGEWNDGHEPAR